MYLGYHYIPNTIHAQVGFWLLLVVVLLFGCSSVLAIVACRHFRKKAMGCLVVGRGTLRITKYVDIWVSYGVM